jgi:hypothetical protein
VEEEVTLIAGMAYLLSLACLKRARTSSPQMTPALRLRTLVAPVILVLLEVDGSIELYWARSASSLYKVGVSIQHGQVNDAMDDTHQIGDDGDKCSVGLTVKLAKVGQQRFAQQLAMILRIANIGLDPDSVRIFRWWIKSGFSRLGLDPSPAAASAFEPVVAECLFMGFSVICLY